MTWWKNFAQREMLEARAHILQDIRRFFDTRGYVEVETPALQTAPCMEPHLQAFKVDYLGEAKYLHTSPEFAMKKLLVAGMPKIYQLAKVFRKEPFSSLHVPEFTLLEWYQTGLSYKGLMEETMALFRHLAKAPIVYKNNTCDVHAPWEVLSFEESFSKYAGIPHILSVEDLSTCGVYLSPQDDRDNALLKIFMEKVEPHLGTPAPTIICDYPISMAALARAKPENPALAERFEVYVCGVELSNGFGELTDANVQRARFEHDVALRQKLYGEQYPVEEDFLAAIAHGLPECSGNALGIDRFIMLLTGAEKVQQVKVPF